MNYKERTSNSLDVNGKEDFYELLAGTLNQLPSYDTKIILGYFNAQLGKEEVFAKVAGNHSLQDNTSGNGPWLVDFASRRNLSLVITRFPHINIHKGTWRSPDQSTVNQIDHIAIDVRHSSSILDVRTF